MMSEFAEYLDYYMEENGISAAELSRETGIERTLVYRYRKGNRTPIDEQTVLRIMKGLRMNETEKRSLMEKYDCLNIGEYEVNSYKYVKKLLKRLKMTGKTSVSGRLHWNISLKDCFQESYFFAHSQDEIISCISAVFAEAKEQEAELMLVMQPFYEPIQKLIPQMFRNSGVRIEQIICLEQRLSKNYKNLEIFQWVLPLCFEPMNYSVQYYYDFLANHINDMSWLPNTIIAGEYVIQFDYEMDKGVFIKDAKYVDVMKQQFIKMKEKTSSFLSGSEDRMGVMDIYDAYGMLDRPNFTCMFEQPCFGLGISSDIYEEFLYPFPDKADFIKRMARFNGDWEDMKLILSPSWAGSFRSFCKVETIRQFMETGRVNEFPSAFYKPLSMDVRKKVLLRTIQAVRSDVIAIYALPEEIEIPSHLFFYWSGTDKAMSVKCMTENGMFQISVQEPGIYQAFQGFFEYLEKKNMLSGKEEVLQEMEKIRKEYW